MRKIHCSFLAAAISLGLMACGGNSTSPERIEPSSDALGYLNYMKSAYSEQAGSLSLERDYEFAVPTTDNSAGEGVADYSGTNVQVSGVDEADHLKFDGANLLWLSSYSDYDIPSGGGNVTRVSSFSEAILDGLEDENPSLHFQPNSDYRYQGMLTYNEQAALVGSSSYWYGGFGPAISLDICFDCGNIGASNEIIAYTWDYAQAGTALIPQPNVITIDGSLHETRLIENKLYVISQFSPVVELDFPYPTSESQRQANQATIDAIELSDIVPNIRINDNEAELYDASDCLIGDESEGYQRYPNVISITQIDLSSPGTWVSTCYVGNTNQAFVSLDNVYLSRSLWQENSVEIIKYALTDAGPAYRATGKVSGSISGDSYYFGEVDDKLAFVNTIYNYENWWESDNYQHQLSILEESGVNLELVAQIPNETAPTPIGKPGELIYAVRFMNERAYIVTFDKVDPLYVIDLSTPEQPEILGELEIPGFSSYIHVINDDLILGIGKNAAEQDGISWFQGLNIRLFDVSEPTQPIMLQSLDYGLRGSDSAALSDPHAFSFVNQSANELFRFAVPMNLHGSAENVDPEAHANTYYDWSESGLYQFEVHTGASPSIAEIGRFNTDEQQFYYANFLDSPRSVINGDKLYFARAGRLEVLDWGENASIRSFEITTE